MWYDQFVIIDISGVSTLQRYEVKIGLQKFLDLTYHVENIKNFVKIVISLSIKLQILAFTI